MHFIETLWLRVNNNELLVAVVLDLGIINEKLVERVRTNDRE